MNQYEALLARILRLEEKLSSSLYAQSRYTKVLRSNASGKGDKVEGQTTGGQPELTRRMGPFGLRSVPTPGTECAVLRVGNSALTGGVIVGTETDKYGPSDLQDGEVALYSVGGATIKIDKDGGITITPKAGQKVKIISDPTGAVELGPDGGPNDQVLIKGSLDSYGVPVTQAPAFTLTTVKAG